MKLFSIINFVQTNICPYKTSCKKKRRRGKFSNWYRQSLVYFVNNSLWKHFLTPNSPQTTSNMIYLTIFLNLRPVACVADLRKSAKIYFALWIISRLFSLRSKLVLKAFQAWSSTLFWKRLSEFKPKSDCV